MGANVTLYPQNLRQDVANDINRMARHSKANDSFHGWDFLALANFMLRQRSVFSCSNYILLLTSLEASTLRSEQSRDNGESPRVKDDNAVDVCSYFFGRS